MVQKNDDVIQNTNIVKQSKANDESWTLDVTLYRQGAREGDNKKPSFTYKIPNPKDGPDRELKYFPITKDGKERTYTVNTSTNIDEYVGKLILKINDSDLFRKFIVTLAQDPEFETMLNNMGGYVGVDQKKTIEINKKRLTNKTNAVAYNVETGHIDALKILRARKVEGGQPSYPRQANLRRSEIYYLHVYRIGYIERNIYGSNPER